MIYWDASARLPLLLKEAPSESHRYASAIARRKREGTSPPQVADSRRMLDALLCEWRDVGRSEQLRRAALRALRSHPLCASDALHLGAALVASGFEPHSIHFRPWDRRLKAAAEREGFV